MLRRIFSVALLVSSSFIAIAADGQRFIRRKHKGISPGRRQRDVCLWRECARGIAADLLGRQAGCGRSRFPRRCRRANGLRLTPRTPTRRRSMRAGARAVCGAGAEGYVCGRKSRPGAALRQHADSIEMVSTLSLKDIKRAVLVTLHYAIDARSGILARSATIENQGGAADHD